MQVLTGYLRNQYRAPRNETSDASTSPGESRCPVEAQVLLVIVGDRYWSDPAGYCLDLSYVELCDAWVLRADFHDIYFWHVKLTGWKLPRCQPARCRLQRSGSSGLRFHRRGPDRRKFRGCHDSQTERTNEGAVEQCGKCESSSVRTSVGCTVIRSGLRLVATRHADFPFLIRANFQKDDDPLGTEGRPLRGPGGAILALDAELPEKAPARE